MKYEYMAYRTDAIGKGRKLYYTDITQFWRTVL